MGTKYQETDLPIRGREILLLLELLLQAHQLELCEDGPAPARLLQPWCRLLCLRLAAAVGLAGGGLGAGGPRGGLRWQHTGAGGSGDELRDHRGLPGDDGDERIRPQGRGPWQGRKQRWVKTSPEAAWLIHLTPHSLRQVIFLLRASVYLICKMATILLTCSTGGKTRIKV